MIQITAVEGNGQWLDGGSMYGNAPRAVWEKWSPPDEKGRIELACRAMLIETESEKILCETGIGAFFEPKLAERFGVQNSERHMLIENLAKLGIDQEDIDFLVLSHLHFDHAGGLLPTFNEIQSGRDDLLFPKATYVLGQEAFERAKYPHSRDRASFIPGMVEKLEASGRLHLVEDCKNEGLPQCLSFFESSGHTPGQLHSIVVGENSKVVFAGDLIPGSSWVHLPITMGYDRYPELLIDEKKELYENLSQENWWVFFTHDPEHSMGKIGKSEKGRYVPTELKDDVKQFSI